MQKLIYLAKKLYDNNKYIRVKGVPFSPHRVGEKDPWKNRNVNSNVKGTEIGIGIGGGTCRLEAGGNK